MLEPEAVESPSQVEALWRLPLISVLGQDDAPAALSSTISSEVESVLLACLSVRRTPLGRQMVP